MNFLSEIKERGYFFQATDWNSLDKILNQGKKITCYVGFDCTAKSLHVGNLTQIMFARTIKKYGHQVIVILGGGTTKVGDPSGKDESRKILSQEQISANISSIKRSILKFIDDATFVDNSEWLDPIKYLDFLRNIGRHFSINRMIEFESVKSRLQRESHLSFLEFNYMILQAYDFVELYKKFGCTLQIGGSDQWGNIVSGIDLGRKLHGAQLFGITSPLITTSSGKKMGKTADGAVWLDKELLSPYNYWQYFRNTDDADVVRFLNLFTDLPLNKIAELSNATSGKEVNDIKKLLATEVTRICHGSNNAENALNAATKEFEKCDSSSLPIIKLDGKFNLVEILSKIGFTQSNSEAKRFIRDSAVRVDEGIINDPGFFPENNSKISLGKKKRVIISY